MGEFKSFEELEQAYKALKQEVGLLEQEWRESGVLEEVKSFECEFLEEQTAKELGVAGVTALGVGTLHKILKLILPSKAATPLIGGAWVLGGAFIIFHFTTSTAAGWAMMVQRNARRKRVLQRKLEALQQHLESMAVGAGNSAAAEGGAASAEPGQQQRQLESLAEGSPDRRISPTHSTGSSAELVEAPSPENEADIGDDGGGGGASASGSGSGSTKKPESSGRSSLDSWKRYASLGSSRKKET